MEGDRQRGPRRRGRGRVAGGVREFQRTWPQAGRNRVETQNQLRATLGDLTRKPIAEM
jgi:hypothetical protein